MHVCAHVPRHVCRGQSQLVGVDSLLLLGGSQAINSRNWAW